jgi:hypothetical protein
MKIGEQLLKTGIYGNEAPAVASDNPGKALRRKLGGYASAVNAFNRMMKDDGSVQKVMPGEKKPRAPLASDSYLEAATAMADRFDVDKFLDEEEDARMETKANKLKDSASLALFMEKFTGKTPAAASAELKEMTEAEDFAEHQAWLIKIYKMILKHSARKEVQTAAENELIAVEKMRLVTTVEAPDITAAAGSESNNNNNKVAVNSGVAMSKTALKKAAKAAATKK